MGTQQVSGLFCARTETEGKGAGYLFCSPEVSGTGGLRMLSNNTFGEWRWALLHTRNTEHEVSRNYRHGPL